MNPSPRVARAAIVVALHVILGTTLASGQVQDPLDVDADLLKLGQHVRNLTEVVSPSVVQVFMSSYGPLRQQSGAGQAVFGTQRGSGSGAVIDPGGLIVTNAHVVDGARRVQVLLPPALVGMDAGDSIIKRQGQLVGASIVGIDHESDLALLRVHVDRPLRALRLGDSDALFPGQAVYAFGSPLGLNNSISFGVVSALGRQLERDAPMVYIQTDAAVNPGNSGGPLVNARGEIVGINTMIFSQGGGNEGISFAIPSNIVRVVADQLRNTGRVTRGVIGVNAQTIDAWMARAMRLPVDRGVILGDVYPQGPAARAGLQVGDIILDIDGKPMENARQFTVNVYLRQPGEEIVLGVVRGGKPRQVTVGVVARPEPDLRFLDLVTAENNLVRRLGILGLDLDADTAALLPPLRQDRGVIVASLTADASVFGEAFEPGDVIYRLNGSEVARVEQLQEQVEKLPYGEPVVFHIERGRELRFLVMEVD